MIGQLGAKAERGGEEGTGPGPGQRRPQSARRHSAGVATHATFEGAAESEPERSLAPLRVSILALLRGISYPRGASPNARANAGGSHRSQRPHWNPSIRTAS